jgi:uncharacterized protein
MFIVYVALDNNKVNIKYTDVYIENLPVEFNTYTILQMTDLHSKEFGNELYDKINNVNYDMITFTGDMINNKDFSMKTLKSLVSNIKNKDIMIYVDGNNGPKTYDENNNKVTDFGIEVEALGCTLLKDTYCIEKSNSRIWISNFDIATNMICYGKKYYYEDKFKQKFSLIGNDVSIGIGHEPVNKSILKWISMNKIRYYKYDLIIAGHYHGGQIRIPFVGAIFVPTKNPKESFFPDKEIVSGLYNYENVSQYVSSGLGASNKIPFLGFRLFNTPQIDIIRLMKK